MRGRYRKPTLEERAYHVETLAMLGRIIELIHQDALTRRAFYVMTVPADPAR